MTVHAVILAGGYGTRMWPLTQRRPKHLLPIGDEPVIAHQLHQLADAGVTSVTLATAYHADAFLPALGRGEAYGLELRYTREPEPLGTAGALRVACDGLELGAEDEIVVVNGDLVSTHSLRDQLDVHRRGWDVDAEGIASAGATPLATIHGRHVSDAGPFGLLHLDGVRVTAFEEKPPSAPAGTVNAGTYVLSPTLLQHVPADRIVSLEREIFPLAVDLPGGILCHRDDAPFSDIGTAAALLDANLAWAQAHGHTSVVLTPDIGNDAQIERSLVLPGARIGDGVTCRDSIIGSGSVIGHGARLERCVLSDDVTVAAGARLADITLECGARVSSGG